MPEGCRLLCGPYAFAVARSNLPSLSSPCGRALILAHPQEL